MFGLCMQLFSLCFLSVTCAFVFKGCELCVLRDAYCRPDYMFFMSEVTGPDATLENRTEQKREGKSKSARFPLLMRNILHISPQKCVFYLFPPCFLLLGFSFFFNCRRFQPEAT